MGRDSPRYMSPSEVDPCRILNKLGVPEKDHKALELGRVKRAIAAGGFGGRCEPPHKIFENSAFLEAF